MLILFDLFFWRPVKPLMSMSEDGGMSWEKKTAEKRLTEELIKWKNIPRW